ncbi:unnamed protein product [Pieris brassicae]|uniref:Uncharacterized protein n=1 Tax=Pieris brassicae TaxID=7116 RepID=A0A9P0XHB8_PIEBR|nr:unnamed protein product [Pieris brassicae]
MFFYIITPILDTLAELKEQMEGGGKQSRLLGRLLGKLRGEHRTLDKNFSFCSTGISETVCCASGTEEDMDTSSTQATTSNTTIDDAQFAAKLDLRYGGQYLTAEQLPEFCNQLHHLVEVIRNIQSYAQVTGEYPAELESRLEREAREVAALAGEAKNARDVCARVTTQRNALHLERGQLVAQLAKMREVEMRELESTVRQCDRKLYKSYEAVRDSTDVNAFEPLLDEIRTKQAALEGLEHGPHSSSRKRHDSRRSNKRRRKEVREPRSVPLSGEPSAHEPQQVTLYIQGSANSSTGSRLRAGSAAAVTLGSLELPSRGSVRDILFFTTNSTL